jgi:hypothetical protein
MTKRDRQTNRQQTGKERGMKEEIKIGAEKLKWWRLKHITAATNCKDAIFSLAI